ncbi:PD-(D/E)XK nuclease family protein [Domibacillus tundrae]|uniref:PD-(D/E)XK nuclease family protein n=1 Tax=Domibacillus tundrae TaxID=1587527 RepID=UPI0009E4CFCB|nr:PD-(D/E)XK nuclease family protein [Domibacillus tundrae]
MSDSRPDLVITFNHGSASHVVFIENKLGSGEGYLQLERYRDHLTLHKLSGFAVHLFYITQYYDPKNMDSVKDHFQQLQWFEVFHWLQEEYREDLYCKQILKYMEEIGLDKTRTFLPQDIYAVQNLWKTLSMLDEYLDGKTAHCFTNLFGKPKQLGTRVTQLRYWNRYVIHNDQSDWKFVGCGFWMEHENYPEAF